MKSIIALLLLTACSTQQPKPAPAPKPQTPQFYRDYKETLSNCTNYVLDNPSNDVLRLAKADDVAISKDWVALESEPHEPCGEKFKVTVLRPRDKQTQDLLNGL